MGVCYDLISDSTREGYDLGKGPWGMDEFRDALRATDQVFALIHLLAEEEPGFSSAYAEKIAKEIVAFVETHLDWRLVNDHQWDGYVVDDEWRAVLVDEGHDPDDRDFPLYRMIGSRHGMIPLKGVAWENLTDRPSKIKAEGMAPK